MDALPSKSEGCAVTSERSHTPAERIERVRSQLRAQTIG
jgi:hypothetical protein